MKRETKSAQKDNPIILGSGWSRVDGHLLVNDLKAFRTRIRALSKVGQDKIELGKDSLQNISSRRKWIAEVKLVLVFKYNPAIENIIPSSKGLRKCTARYLLLKLRTAVSKV